MSVASSNVPAAGIETASLWARTRAIVADLIIVSILQAIINGVFGSEYITNGALDPSVTGGYSSYTSTTTVDGLWLWVAAIAYFAVLEGLFGQTVGKAVVGIRVTDLAGGRIGWRAALIRNIFRLVDSFPGVYLVGVLVARFSARRQRWGDQVAHTIVVPSRVATGPHLTEEQRRRRVGFVLGVMALFIAGSAAFSYYGRPAIALGNAARLAQLSGGRVASLRHGPAQWNGGSVTYPVTYTLAGSGKTCTGLVTLYWDGFLESWHMGNEEANCQ
jgi:uncharacterized RDD family membrane protein YckC